MSQLLGLYAMWLREIKVYSREKSRMASSIFTPILWLFVFGKGLGASVSIGDLAYDIFIYPGILAMSTLFTSLFFGVYIVWDKRVDFLKEVLVSPLSRTTIFLGKVLGGMTDALIQVTILLLLGPLLGISFSLTGIGLVYVTVFLLSLGIVSIGLIIGSVMESPEGFGLIVSFVAFPLFFLSGALFPIENLPRWLSTFVFIDPVTYGVDALRQILLGAGEFSILFSLTALLVFSLTMVYLGTVAFERM
ncbi:MAG: ABC transporter permease, partial [Candidatus Hydrothermarchaeales archaeon]